MPPGEQNYLLSLRRNLALYKIGRVASPVLLGVNENVNLTFQDAHGEIGRVFEPSQLLADGESRGSTIDRAFAATQETDVDEVIDVGANREQFTLACRIAMPIIPVLTFEPIPEEAVKSTRIHGGENNVVLLKSALAEARSKATLHISRSLDSSSLLPIRALQTTLFPNTAESGTITVPVQMLDDSLELTAGRQRQLLKLDVQGYELNVLKGAVKTLALC